MSSTHAPYGAQPIPLTNGATPFTFVPPPVQPVALRPALADGAIPPLPGSHTDLNALARMPIRRGVIVPVVGCNGGAGRTTLARLLAQACLRLRGQHPIIVDAVPVLGGLTAAADRPGDYSPVEVAQLPWPPQPGITARLLTTVDGIPALTGPSPARGARTTPAQLLIAVGRLAAGAHITFIDTLADAAGEPNRSLVSDRDAVVVWVTAATRTGLWGIAEAVTYYRAIGTPHLAERSIAAIIGPRRRWPDDAATAETQLNGFGVQTERIPHSAEPLTDSHCQAAAERLIAAIVARSVPASTAPPPPPDQRRPPSPPNA